MARLARSSTFLAWLACGGGVGPDGPIRDPGPLTTPTPTPSAPTVTGDTGVALGSVDVRVLEAVSRPPLPPVLEPLEGAPVSAAAPDGSFFARATTDAEGRASIELPPGGSISVVRSGDVEAVQVETVFGVEDGDSLTFSAPTVDLTALGAIEVDLGADPAGGSFAKVALSCGSDVLLSGLPEEGATLRLEQPCDAGTFDVLAASYLDGLYQEAQGFVSGTVAVGGEPLAGAIDLGDGWSTEHGTVSLQYTGSPSQLDGTVNGVFGTGLFTLGKRPASPATPIVGRVSPAFDRIVTQATISPVDGSVTRYDVRLPPAVGESELVVLRPGDFLPPLVVEAIDEEAPSLSLTGAEPAAACGEARLVSVSGTASVRRELDDRFASADWWFLSPPTSTIALPELDPALGEVWPTAGRLVRSQADVASLAGADLDYAALRARPGVTRASLSVGIPSVESLTCRAAGRRQEP